MTIFNDYVSRMIIIQRSAEIVNTNTRFKTELNILLRVYRVSFPTEIIRVYSLCSASTTLNKKTPFKAHTAVNRFCLVISNTGGGTLLRINRVSEREFYLGLMKTQSGNSQVTTLSSENDSL